MTRDLSITAFPAPDVAVFPMAQHIGAPCSASVQKGERVLIGQEIGSMKGFVSAPIHSSISGTVLAVEQRMTISGAPVLSVVVKDDGKDEWLPDIKPGEDIAKLEPAQIKEIVKNAGIVGLGGASFPTHVKLSPPADCKIDTVIINGAECEPYLTSDHRIMLEHPKKVAGGLGLVMKALGTQKGVLAIEINKKDAMDALRPHLGEGMRIVALEVKYPQGSEKQLIESVAGRQVPSGGLPAAAGCLVVNAGTSVAVYDAVHFGRPIVDTVLTVTGAVNKPGNFLVRTGTPIKDIIEHCGGLREHVAKVVAGGPMMGVALYNLDVPVQKSTSGILALAKNQLGIGAKTHCLRCGRCAQACPIHLLPMMLNRFACLEKWEEAEQYNALDCMECGSCTYVCPAKLDITSNLRAAKRAILASRKRG